MYRNIPCMSAPRPIEKIHFDYSFSYEKRTNLRVELENGLLRV